MHKMSLFSVKGGKEGGGGMMQNQLIFICVECEPHYFLHLNIHDKWYIADI